MTTTPDPDLEPDHPPPGCGRDIAIIVAVMWLVIIVVCFIALNPPVEVAVKPAKQGCVGTLDPILNQQCEP